MLNDRKNHPNRVKSKLSRAINPCKKEPPKRETEPESVEAQQPAPKNADDPDFKKLESVENARDPAYLLKAQMLLQAQQKPAPDNKDKTW